MTIASDLCLRFQKLNLLKRVMQLSKSVGGDNQQNHEEWNSLPSNYIIDIVKKSII